MPKLRLARGSRAHLDIFRSIAVSRFVALLIAGMTLGCGGVALLLALHAGRADALPSISCSASGETLTISVSGLASDSLVVTTSGGFYQIELDGTQECQSYSDSGFPTVQVTETSSPFVPTVFQPGTDTGITFVGPGGTTTLDLSAAPSGTTISVVTGTVSGLSGGGTDTFSGIASFTGSSSGNTTFAAGPTGGYSFTGQGTGNSLNLSAANSGITVSAASGTVSGLSSGTDTFSGIASFTGSSSGNTTLVAGPGSETFGDPGTSGHDTIDFSGLSSSSSTPLSINLSGVTESGVFNDTATLGPDTYTFTGVGSLPTTFVGSSSGATTVYAGGTGGYSFTGQGTGNSLNLSAANSGITVSAATGTVSGLSSGTDTFSGIASFTGSSTGDTTFAAGPTGGYSFTGQGTGNSLNLSAAPSGTTISVVTGTMSGLSGEEPTPSAASRASPDPRPATPPWWRARDPRPSVIRGPAGTTPSTSRASPRARRPRSRSTCRE